MDIQSYTQVKQKAVRTFLPATLNSQNGKRIMFFFQFAKNFGRAAKVTKNSN